MLRSSSDKRVYYYFIWLLLGLCQAYFSQLSSDEAYYWVYSQQLAWGYYDHPPMVAFLIKCGYSLFQNELGVRLFFVLLFIGAIYFLERIVKPESPFYFHLSFAGVAFLQLINFMALPDVPLFFFTVCFLFVYQRFLEKGTWVLSLLLGVLMACMLLSKYHAFLVLLIVLFSNISLLKNKWIYLSISVTSVLCLPHLLWQFNHDFPSVYYHFSGRNENYQFFYTLEFFGNQLLLLLPFIGLLFFIATCRRKAQTAFEKSLKWLFIGFYFFFFLMSFKGRVEPHWTVLSFIPLIYFGYKTWEGRFNRIRNYLLLSLVLILIARAFITFDILPENHWTTHFRRHFHQAQDKALVIDSLSNGRPVAFMNSYQSAALYDFYGKSKPSIALNNIYGRENQYELWMRDTSILGKDILLLPNYPSDDFGQVRVGEETVLYQNNYSFKHFSGIDFTVEEMRKQGEDSIAVALRIVEVPQTCENYIDAANLQLSYQVFDGQLCVLDQNVGIELSSKNLIENELLNFSISKMEFYAGRKLYFSITQVGLPPSINSRAWVIDF